MFNQWKNRQPKYYLLPYFIAFTAHAVVCNYTDHMICHMTSDYNDEDIDLLVSGGGAMNNYLMRYPF